MQDGEASCTKSSSFILESHRVYLDKVEKPNDKFIEIKITLENKSTNHLRGLLCLGRLLVGGMGRKKAAALFMLFYYRMT